jgi:hypothetical protein
VEFWTDNNWVKEFHVRIQDVAKNVVITAGTPASYSAGHRLKSPPETPVPWLRFQVILLRAVGEHRVSTLNGLRTVIEETVVSKMTTVIGAQCGVDAVAD